MKLLEEENIDVALLPIGGYYTMDTDDAVRAAGFIRAKVVIPMHYNTFPVIKADPSEFVKKCARNSLDAKVLGFGEETLL